MNWLARPTIESCVVDHDPICIGSLTPVTLSLQGWGYVSITAREYPQWPGIRNTFVPGKNVLSFPAPNGAILRIRCCNLFGWASVLFVVRERNVDLGTFNPPEVNAAAPRVVVKLPQVTVRGGRIFTKQHSWLTPRLGMVKLARATVSNVTCSVRPAKGEFLLPSSRILHKSIKSVFRRNQIQPWIEDRHSSKMKGTQP